MVEGIRRRHYLRVLGLTGTGVLAGCSGNGGDGGGTEEGTATKTGVTTTTESTTTTETGGTTTTGTNALAQTVENKGYFVVNNAGTRTSPAFDHLYRSDSQPLRMETDVGGVVASRPTNRGIELMADLTAEDAFAGSSVYFGNWNLQEVSRIDFSIDSDEIRIVVQLDLNDDGDFLDWKDADGNKQQFAGFDGDDRAISEYQSDGEVTAEEAIFKIPPGGAETPSSSSGGSSTQAGLLSIEDLQERFEDASVWIGAGIDHNGLDLPAERSPVITAFSVETLAKATT